MFYYRRKILLALLEELGGHLSALQMQKFLFLFTRKQEDNKAFEFVPYKYGGFSFQANQDIYTLSKYGYLEIADNKEKTITLSKTGHYILELDMFDQQAIRDVCNEFGALSTTDLVRYTYTHYPFYAINSTIAEQILTTEELEKVDKQRRHIDNIQLFTIGYEGRTLESYIKTLILNDVHLLCDVRKNAYSQKFGFSKSQLQNACQGVGIEYVHVPALGIGSEQRQNLYTQDDYNRLFALYASSTLAHNAASLQYVYDLIQQNKRVALTCFEKDPNQCHRYVVAKALLKLPNANYSLKNL